MKGRIVLQVWFQKSGEHNEIDLNLANNKFDESEIV